MDKFAKGENEMWNASEGTHSNKNSLSISSEESAGLSASAFGLPRHSLEDVQVKIYTHKPYSDGNCFSGGRK